MNKKLINLQKIGIPLVVVLLIILGVIYLLSKNNSVVTNSVDNSTLLDTSNTDSKVTLFAVEDLYSAKVDGSVVKFDSSYFINTNAQAYKFDNFTCGLSETAACVVNQITDKTDNYYLTSPYPAIAEDYLPRSVDAVKTLSTSVGDASFKYATVELTDDSGKVIPDSNFITQIYGCVKNTICVSSGLFNRIDININKAQVTKFENFVKSLTIQ